MARDRFDDQLGEVGEAVVDLAELVCDRLRTALGALVEGDERRAERVLDGSRDVAARCAEVESACFSAIALQHPVAGDLRYLLSSFAVVGELRQLSALADRFGQYARIADGSQFGPVDVRSLSELAVGTAETAVDAYRRLAAAGSREERDAVADDDGPCHGTVLRRERLGRFCGNASEGLVLWLADPENAPADADEMAVRLAAVLAVRDLRRVGIRAVNIAGRVLHAATNDDGLINRYDTRRSPERA
ncbi:phosphate uptake regulator PhoU [Halomarina halobia]|uniref:Phosphate uptake regulator PhoU n=1 Tax=Halomarina halobia TaxID=3033386 RepID=A0ABD6AAD0_9EURY|nr:PhoU domain-containing protein [Halomarina sp. PSR21]